MGSKKTPGQACLSLLAEVCFRDFPVLKLKQKTRPTRSGDPGVDPRAGEASNREVAEDVKSGKTVTNSHLLQLVVYLRSHRRDQLSYDNKI